MQKMKAGASRSATSCIHNISRRCTNETARIPVPQRLNAAGLDQTQEAASTGPRHFRSNRPAGMDEIQRPHLGKFASIEDSDKPWQLLRHCYTTATGIGYLPPPQTLLRERFTPELIINPLWETAGPSTWTEVRHFIRFVLIRVGKSKLNCSSRSCFALTCIPTFAWTRT